MGLGIAAPMDETVLSRVPDLRRVVYGEPAGPAIENFMVSCNQIVAESPFRLAYASLCSDDQLFVFTFGRAATSRGRWRSSFILFQVIQKTAQIY